MFSKVLKLTIRGYISLRCHLPHKRVCVFYPTCSEYALEAIDKHGAFYGGYMAVKRLIRCHPWQKDVYDPVR